jgi:RNA binding chromodomain-containing protein
MKKLILAAILGLLLLPLPALALGNGVCVPGDKAQVLWHGTWYPATVLKAQGTHCYIHYEGYGNNWDEWVGPGRIQVVSSGPRPPLIGVARFQPGDPVQVLWGSKWWPAHVLRVKGYQLYIHYDGYGNNWDEWVGPERYR